MKSFCIIFLLLCSSLVEAQNSQINLPAQSNPWRVGGGVGLGFGSNDYFGFSISPFVGYQIDPSVELGVSAGYQYSKWNYAKQHLFNAGPYLNFYPIPQFFARAHYEYYTGQMNYNPGYYGGASRNFDESALWLGAGYRSLGRVQFFVGLMYNVLYDEDDSVFANGLRPIMGVSFAL